MALSAGAWVAWRRALLALFAFCIVAGARAQAGDSEALLELVLDGKPTAVIGHFVMRDGRPLASYAEWQAYGVRAAALGAASPAAAALVGLDQWPGVRATVDDAAQALRIDQGPDPDALTVLGPTPEALAPAVQQDTGALVNYDVTAQGGAGRSTWGALVKARAFVAAGVLEHTVVTSDAGGGSASAGSGSPAGRHTVRLDTSVSTADPARLRRLRGGDVVAGALGWTRPMRLFGVQALTDFALRPDLVTAPTPLLSGTAAVPSTVDVLVNGVRQLSQPVEPGRFEVRQPPIVSGAGEVSVVVRDALGRETVQRLPFYATASQLAAGVSSYSVEAGRIRRRFGVASADYGALAGSASWRAGITDRFTTEAHVEGSREVQQGGFGGLLAVPRVGAFNAHVALSRTADRGGGGVAGGWMAGVGAERQSGVFNMAAQIERAGRNYRDLAASQGDASYARTARVSGGVDLGRFGALGMAWVQRDPIASPAGFSGPSEPVLPAAASARLLTASYSVSLPGRVQGYVSAFRSSASANGGGVSSGVSGGVSVGVLIPFGDRRIVTAGVTHDRSGGTSLDAQATQVAFEPGTVGWRVQANEHVAGGGPSGAAPSQQRGEVEYLARGARVSAAVDRVGNGGRNTSSLTLGAQGALIALGGGLHVSRAVNDSVALVDVPGTPGVAVFHQNRYVGRTDAQGQLIVPNLMAYQANQLTIDPLDLPMDRDAERFDAQVRPADRSGVVVRFQAERSRTALLRLLDATGTPLPLGTIVTPRSGGPPAVVGYDGQAYVGVDPTNARLDARLNGAPLCSSAALAPAPETWRGRAMEVTCR